MTPYAAALSEHPLPTHAAGEVIGQVLEDVGHRPDLAVLFLTAAHGGAIEDVANAVRAVLEPSVLVGVTAVSILGGDREVEEQPAISLWAGNLGGRPTPVRLDVVTTDDGTIVSGLPADAADGDRTLILLTDPFSLAADSYVEALATSHPQLRVVGGLASAARGPGGNRLALDDRIFTDGAVGVLLPRDAAVDTLVSQGCRPIGDPMIVTRAEGRVLFELAGQPALDRLLAVVDALDPDDRALAQQGLHMGRVIDERQETFGRGDFLVRNVLGGDRSAGAIAVGDVVPVGATVQLHVRDAMSADDDLEAILSGTGGRGALVFTCNGRGMHLFGTPDHDALAVSARVGPAVAGMFCAGEIGPVGDRSFLHGFTASVLVFS